MTEPADAPLGDLADQLTATPLMPARAVKEAARRLGFLACGITDTAPTPHGEALDAWLAKGYAGTMRYLHRQATKRKEPQRIVPEARSIVVVLDNYFRPDPPAPGRPRIAKYARGRDYHLATRERLRALEAVLREHGATVARSYVDAGPVPERELAQRAGLGWIGKNTMLIRPGVGAYFFIGAVFTDLPLALDQPFDADHCGTCTRCLEACPTSAITSPHVLDATRCISYLTIEYRGEVPQALADRFEGWAFGCDVCNDVCPWNERFARPTSHPEFATRTSWTDLGPDAFDRMTPEEFETQFGDTPLERPGLAGMRRNWRLAMDSLSEGKP